MQFVLVFLLSINLFLHCSDQLLVALFEVKLGSPTPTLCSALSPSSDDAVLSFFRRHLRPSMMQQLLRRLVFDVPMLTEYCKIPLQVGERLERAGPTSRVLIPPRTIHRPSLESHVLTHIYP